MSLLKTSVQSIKDVGSCNYCKGKLNAEGNGLDFGYRNVIVVQGTNCSTNFCVNCAETLRLQLATDLKDFIVVTAKNAIKAKREEPTE